MYACVYGIKSFCVLQGSLFICVFCTTQHTQNSIYYYIIITMSVGFETKIPSENFDSNHRITIVMYLNFIFLHICGIYRKLTVHVFFFFFCYFFFMCVYVLPFYSLTVCTLSRIDDLISFKASCSQLCEP